LADASEASGLNESILWSLCSRLDVPEDAIPETFAIQLNWQLNALLGAIVERVGRYAEAVRHG
jgi:hypothetical protein